MTADHDINRHRRTHEAQADGQPFGGYSDEDFEAEENEFGSLEEDSSPSEHGYMTQSMTNITSMPLSNSNLGMGSMAPPQMIHPSQMMLQQRLT